MMKPILSAIGGLSLACASASASTAAFGGRVIEVKDPAANHKETLKFFTVEIDYYDYCSWNKFGKHSKVGEPITRQVKKVGTYGMIDGRPVNAATFAKAIRPGLWGYFYEDTWLDLQTTPEFQWGEVVKADAAKGEFTLRIHRTHKDVHLETNPPVEVKVELEKTVQFRIEENPADAASVLKPGTWVQVHPPRPTMISLWTKGSAPKPGELLPHKEGKRGYANDLSAPAVFHKVSAENPEGVIDKQAEIEATRILRGKKDERVTLQAKKVSFALDGKLAPAKLITSRADRWGNLGHYRGEDRPHKAFVRSFGDETRGVVIGANEKSMGFKDKAGGMAATLLRGDSTILLDGCEADRSAIKAGLEVVVYPMRPQTVIAIPAQ